uniref:Regulatory factor X-associated protein n=1 Tax=Neogobius melanostomus TaxID=47308 RepID=A0A8C6SKD0_9GOBI
MSEDDKSPSTNKDKESTLLFTKDGQKYYLNKSGGLDSRNVVTPHDPENNASYDMDDADEEGDMLDTSDPRDNAASPEELNDEDGCTETTTQVAKQRKPWMCKKHRNKMYKDKYKKKKNDQAMSSGKLDNAEERPVSVNKQRLGAMGDRPARPSLIEQVLNQKRLSLLRSPEVMGFLQQQQQLLATQNRGQTQQQFQGC